MYTVYVHRAKRTQQLITTARPGVVLIGIWWFQVGSSTAQLALTGTGLSFSDEGTPILIRLWLHGRLNAYL